MRYYETGEIGYVIVSTMIDNPIANNITHEFDVDSFIENICKSYDGE